MCLNDVGTGGDKREWKHRTVLLWTSAMENSRQVSVYQEFSHLIYMRYFSTNIYVIFFVNRFSNDAQGSIKLCSTRQCCLLHLPGENLNDIYSFDYVL